MFPSLILVAQMTRFSLQLMSLPWTLRGTAMEAKALKKTLRGYGLLGDDVGVGPINLHPHYVCFVRACSMLEAGNVDGEGELRSLKLVVPLELRFVNDSGLCRAYLGEVSPQSPEMDKAFDDNTWRNPGNLSKEWLTWALLIGCPKLSRHSTSQS